MFVLLLCGQVIVLIGILAVSAWGWRHVAPEARMRVRSGPTGIDWTISRNTALTSTPLVGLLVVIGTAALTDSADRATVGSLGVAVMIIFLGAHWSSVRRAAR